MLVSVNEIAEWSKGAIVYAPEGNALRADSLEWDSRKVTKGCLYVAFPGERVDGHRFVASAIESGAAAALISQDADGEMLDAARRNGAALVKVDDTAQAVTDLACRWRAKLPARIIGLTGSVGKTTTKNLVRDVLSAQFKTVATEKNQNNELGVPNTILRANMDTEAVVVEMGMRGLGQIEALCAFVRPEWGLITNVGDCHIELLGSRDNIARAKAELFEALPEDGGIAFVNAGNEYAAFLQDHAKLQERGVTCVRYDGTPEARDRAWDVEDGAPAVWATDIELDKLSRPHFTVHARGFAEGSNGACPCRLSLRGMHNVSNAAAAAAIGCAMGMGLAQICDALAAALPEAGRQEVLSAARGFTVINDAYNANPDSMRASLAMFAAMEVEGRRIAVLGDMGELGSFERRGHEIVGEVAAGLPIDLLVCVGPLSANIARAACEAGMPAERIMEVRGVEEALAAVNERIEKNDAVLVKASHYMGLDQLAESLVK